MRANSGISANTVASAAARNKTSRSNNSGGNRVINDVIGAMGNLAGGIYKQAMGRSGGYTPQPQSPTQPKVSTRSKPQVSINDIARAVVNTGKGIYGEATGKGNTSNKGRVVGKKPQPRQNPVIFGQEMPALGPNQSRGTINPQYAALLKAAGYPTPASNGQIVDNSGISQSSVGTGNPTPVDTRPGYDGREIPTGTFQVPEVPVEDRTPLSEQTKAYNIWYLQKNGTFPPGFEYLITYPEYQPYLQYLR